jgi:predicted DNA-binding transcriptional regulator YafY
MFAPARIRSLKETGERFERPPDFRIGDYLDKSFRSMRGAAGPRRVRLRFTGEAARYVKLREWHPTQKLRQRHNGSLELTLTVTHFLEVRRWVMGYGPECEVLEPNELREQVHEGLRRAAKVYEVDG